MTGDFFTAYADQAIPKTIQRKDAKKAQREADRIQAMQDEDNILRKMATAQDRIEREATIEQCEDPQALRSILAWLRKARVDDADAIIETVRQAAETFAGRRARALLLLTVCTATQRIRRNLDLEPLEDPIPPETSVFIDCREILK